MRKKAGKASAVRTPVQNRSIEKRAEILVAARQLFNKNSYEKVNVRMISKKAGLSIGTIYSYFGDKRDVFIEVTKQYSEELYEGLAASLEDDLDAADSLESALLKIVHTLKKMLARNATLHRETIILALSDASFRGHHHGIQQKTANRIGGLFISRFSGVIRVSDQAAAIFIVYKAIEEIVQYFLFYEVELDEERILHEMTRMIAGYLRSK